MKKERFVLLEFEGYEHYAISDRGRVKNVRTARILHTACDSYGYPMAHFSVDGKKWCPKIHRLVALHFLSGSWFEGAQVNHIDGCKENNQADNLEWVSAKENHRHARDLGLISRGNKPFEARHVGTGDLLHFESLKEAAVFLHGNKANVSRALNGLKKTYKGYAFHYV